ncbi:MAG: hypothetical protein PWP23_1247 [Candidatus Sumerlaeota bacterium]|nr:hypothetical protein [Candidatus Sumerlaeota bacterium]
MTKPSSEPIVYIVTPFENRMAKRGTRLPVLADMLADRGFQVEYLTTNFSHAYKRHFTEEEIATEQAKLKYRMTVFSVPGYRSNISVRRIICNLLMAWQICLHLTRKLRRDSVIVVPSRPVELVFCIAIVRRLRACRAVLDIRDIWPDALMIRSAPKKAVFSAYCNIHLHPSLARYDRYVHISPSFVDWLHRYAPAKDSIFLPPGFDAWRWEGLTKKDYTAFPQPLRIVCVGLLQHQIDVMPVLEALVTRPDVTLTIVGDPGEGQRYPKVKAFIEEHRMANVELIGAVPPERMRDYLADKHIGLVPMISDSIPNKVFDYIGAFLPILALGDFDTADFVEDQGIGWRAGFDGESVGKLLDALSVSDLREKSHRVAEIRDSWNRETLFEKFIDIITSLLPEGARTRKVKS